MSTRSVAREPEGFKTDAPRSYALDGAGVDPEASHRLAARRDGGGELPHLHAFPRGRRQHPPLVEEEAPAPAASSMIKQTEGGEVAAPAAAKMPANEPTAMNKNEINNNNNNNNATFVPTFKNQIGGAGGSFPQQPQTSHNFNDHHNNTPLIHADLVGYALTDVVAVVEPPLVATGGDDANKNTIPMDQQQQQQQTSAANGNHNDKAKRRRWIWIAAIVSLVVVGVVGIIAAVVMTRGGSGDGKSGENEQTFVQLGGDVLRPEDDDQLFFGSDVAISLEGHRIVVASIGTVTAYEVMPDKSSLWRRIGQTMDIAGITGSSFGGLPKILDHGLISVAMGRQGNIIVVGYGQAADSTGMVKVYYYDDIGDTWIDLGPILNGTTAGDRFGTAVDVSDDEEGQPIVVAVGAPGSNGGAGSVRVYKYDPVDQTWQDRGVPIVGEVASTTVTGLGGSVSLSRDGTRVAAAGRSLPDAAASFRSAVVRTFDYQTVDNRWNPLDAGFAPPAGLLSSTGWTVDLSADGNRMVISNSYLMEDDFVNTDPEGLSVRVLALTNGLWSPIGGELHKRMPGPKSGYVVAFSDDGTVIGMGDPGTSSGGRNVNGHAHLYRQNDDGAYVQVGPNLDGINHADSFGFAVALSGDGRKLAVGIPLSRAAGDNAGLVQVFETLQVS